jgi:tetratricopeptide (TPR) repeat protein
MKASQAMISRRRIFQGVAICLLIGGPAPLQADFLRPPPVDVDALRLPKEVDELHKAIESFQKGDYEQALKFLQAAAKKREDLIPPRLILAKLFLLHNQIKQGRDVLEQAAVESPEHPEIYLIFGRLALQEGRLTDARLHFDTAAELARSKQWPLQLQEGFLRDAHAGRASEAEQRRSWSDAQTALTAWLKLEPKNGQARQRLGAALFRQGKHDQGRREMEQAMQDDPKLEPAAIALGWLYTEIGQQDQAAQWMEAAVKEAPKDFRAHLSHARWLLEQNRAEEAGRAADAAARLAPDSRDTQFLRGLIARTCKDYAPAERLFETLHQQSPGDFSISNQLALTLVEQTDDSKRQKALQLAEINARLYPNAGEALSTLGLVYYRLGRTEDAEKALRASLSGGAGSSDTVYYLARLLAERGQVDEAKRLLKLALDAPGLFSFRKEAREQLEHLNK